MTRQECEQQILDKMKEISDLYLQYNPTGKYLAVFYTENGISANNQYWEEDKNLPINKIRWKVKNDE